MSIVYYIRHKCHDFFLKRKFKKYGVPALKVFSELATKYNWNYSLIFGTLLGAYREKNFIKNDDDIDIIVNRKNINQPLVKQMISCGFTLKAIYLSSDKEMAHVSFNYHGITFDIYGFNVNYHGGDSVLFVPNPPKGMDWQQSAEQNFYQACRVHFNYIGTETITFQGVRCEILANTKEFLSNIYGDDFMIPQSKKGFQSPFYEYVPLTEMTAGRVDFSQLNND